METIGRISLFVVMLLFCVPALGAEYFLSPEGNDESPGTRARPWRSIARANESLRPGDTATFLPGRYAGVIEPGVSGEKGKPITYRSEKRLGAILTGGKASDGRSLCVRLKERDHITIEGFHLLPEAGDWVLYETTRYCVLRRCRMEGASRSYIPAHMIDCHYNRYEELEVWRSVQLGQTGHVSGNMFQLNASSRNVIENCHFGRAGHCPFCLWIDSHHNVVRGCVFDGRWGRNFELFTAPRTLFEGCVITNTYHGSGSADGRAKLFTRDGIFRRNLVYRNYYQPLTIHAYRYQQMEPFGMIDTRMYQNTFVANAETGFEMFDISARPDPHMVRGNVLLNNLFAFNDADGDGVALNLGPSIGRDNRFVHNLFYGVKPGTPCIRYAWNDGRAGPLRTAAEANAACPEQFTGNLDGDPRFMDRESDDYRLRPDSPALDAGAPLTVTRDAGRGRLLPVEDARPFYDGFGIPGEQGDLIFIGPRKHQARVVQADLDANTLLLDRQVSWEKGEGVSLPYIGKAPDPGAYERGAEKEAWYRAPRVREGLRLPTMETATEPTVVVDFEPENREEWFYRWYLNRQRNTTAHVDNTTAASGKNSLRVFATDDGAVMGALIRPREWNIDRFPLVRFSYRVPPGVPVGIWVEGFPLEMRSTGMVCLGGSPARACGSSRDLKKVSLVDDGQWHEAVIDVRAIREVYPEVRRLRTFYLLTRGNGKKGQEYWIDRFRITPEGKE